MDKNGPKHTLCSYYVRWRRPASFLLKLCQALCYSFPLSHNYVSVVACGINSKIAKAPLQLYLCDHGWLLSKNHMNPAYVYTLVVLVVDGTIDTEQLLQSRVA
jgi:hypothetical protein